jgi:hypothetical protein
MQLPYQIATCLAAVLIYPLAKVLSLDVRVVGGQIGMIGTLVVLPIVA